MCYILHTESTDSLTVKQTLAWHDQLQLSHSHEKVRFLRLGTLGSWSWYWPVKIQPYHDIMII